MIRDTVTGKLTEMTTEGVFVAIGHSPATSIFSRKCDMQPSLL